LNIVLRLSVCAAGCSEADAEAIQASRGQIPGIGHRRSEENDCVFLKEAAAYVGCTIKDRLEAGDHWIIYATVDTGKVLTESAPSAVHHRKIGTSY